MTLRHRHEGLHASICKHVAAAMSCSHTPSLLTLITSSFTLDTHTRTGACVHWRLAERVHAHTHASSIRTHAHTDALHQPARNAPNRRHTYTHIRTRTSTHVHMCIHTHVENTCRHASILSFCITRGTNKSYSSTHTHACNTLAVTSSLLGSQSEHSSMPRRSSK